jgi:C-terminal processing protease CtpA/Prc
MRRPLIASLVLAFACGGNKGAPSYKDAAGKCASPRTGSDPITGKAYPDKPGSLNDEKTWLRGWIDDFYLWYHEVPAVDPSQYGNAIAYFLQLKTQAVTASNKPKDRFHFTSPTADWEAFAQSGAAAGYGATWALVATSPPRLVYVAYTETPSPAVSANLARGAQVIQVDGAAVVDGDKNVLNAGLFPLTGETHTFVIQDRGSTTTRTITMKSATVISTPVQNVHLLPNTTVGYMLFNSHNATAEKGLIDGINTLKNAGATDLVLDLRYNGGGYLVIAAQLAYMIAKPSVTSGKTFEKTSFNDKYPTNDPITGSPITPTPFVPVSVGLSVPQNQPLPHLDLDRVFVLTGGNTCSASEAVINGLLGAGIQVNLIGGTTCGKPYGFYPQDNCGTTYFSIQFQGVNDKGFGDYGDGFKPSGSSTAAGSASPPGCLVADDFMHDLGDPAEARLAAALGFRNNGSCPPVSMMRSLARVAGGEDVTLVRNPFLENRILWRPQ